MRKRSLDKTLLLQTHYDNIFVPSIYEGGYGGIWHWSIKGSVWISGDDLTDSGGKDDEVSRYALSRSYRNSRAVLLHPLGFSKVLDA